MATSFDDTIISIWRHALVENADAVKVGAERYPVTKSKTKRLRQVEFEFDGNTIIGIEQNPKTKSRWLKWRVPAKRLCSLFKTAGTLLS
jgi:hypothetical protein